MLWLWPLVRAVSAPITGKLGRGPLVLTMCPIPHPKAYYVAWCCTHMVRW